MPAGPAPSDSSSSSVTFAPLGGVKAKVSAAGLAKSTWVKPASTTALPPVLGVSVNFSGTPFCASTETLIAPIVEPLCFGLMTSWYASRPAIRAVPPTVTEVVPSTAFRASVASSLGVTGGSCASSAPPLS